MNTTMTSRDAACACELPIHFGGTTLVGGLLQENPFYVPPEQFIRELRARKAKGTVATT
jgi:hypothetical protein